MACRAFPSRAVLPLAGTRPGRSVSTGLGGTGAARHYAPVAWPAENGWTAYTMQGANQKDAKTLDPSNGGTSPQNYVNVTSGCTDLNEPSIYYAYDAVNQVVFFRWRVQQQANTYATGPSAGSFASTDPWRSALWTVLIDVTGDGYRDFAVQLDGSIGSPSTPIDLLTSYYSTTLSQAIDPSDPNTFIPMVTKRCSSLASSASTVSDARGTSHAPHFGRAIC